MAGSTCFYIAPRAQDGLYAPIRAFLAKSVILKSAPGDFLVDTPVEATLHAQLGMPPTL